MISDNYVTGDNIYLRELQNFFFEVLGMMSITHYGAVGDGRVDNYGPLQVAIDDAHRRGLNFLYVPYGRFIYTGELQNIGDLIFMGNPHAHIVNIRTGEEIEIHQFGWLSDNYYSKIEADGKFVNITGDTMTGPLAIGETATASGNLSFAQGTNVVASGNRSHAEGSNTTASANNAHAEGYGTTASSFMTHAEGGYTQATAGYSHAEGYNTLASGGFSHAQGYYTTASGNTSFAGGACTTATLYTQFVIGANNIVESGDPAEITSSQGLFIVGNGAMSEGEPGTASNALRLTKGGDLYIAGSLNPVGADYAECFEWADGNPNNEDRVGKFAIIENNKIRLATSQDYKELMGVISAKPTVLGDAYDNYWHGKYVTDAYGRIQYQTVSVPAQTDENGNIIRPQMTEEVPVISPDFDATLEYVSRADRKEYGKLALLGKLVVEDDGTCEVGGYCFPNDNGIATKKYEGFYVLERIDETHVRILVR